MPPSRIVLLTTLAMLAFALNSLLCRLALKETPLDAATFTTIRLISGTIVLWLFARRRSSSASEKGSWISAFALFMYAAGFSFAYIHLSASTGALLLFGAVQITMIGRGLYTGERLGAWQSVGLALAVGGLVALLTPGISAPPFLDSLWMLAAGVAWAVYSLRGRGVADPVGVNAGNFLLAIPMSLALSALTFHSVSLSAEGIVYAVLSGALASGVGYALWYKVLPMLAATRAASVQLSVPVFTAIGGVLILSEPLTLRLLLTSAAILAGIALVILGANKIAK